MAAPTLQPLDVQQPLGTPAEEWAQQTVQAIDPNATTGLVTDPSGNPTTDHTASAIAGVPGHGPNAEKTPVQMRAEKANAPHATDPIPLAKGNDHANGGHFTDAQGNPTSDPKASALQGTPPAPPAPGYVADSTVTTPGVQLPGGWIRGPESRQNSMAAPQTSLYEDVSAALGTVGQAAFSAIPPGVIGNLSNSPPPPEPATISTPKPEDTTKVQPPPSPPARTSSPGLLSRAQGMFSGLLARPASPATKLPAPDAPTTTGEAALVGGGAVASTANDIGDSIASGQNLGGHDPKGVLADEGQGEPNLHSEGTAQRTGLPQGANTAAMFLNPDVSTPDPEKPPQDPGLSGSVFPVLADDPKKGKGKPPVVASTLSPDQDVQAAASKSNQDFSTPVPGTGTSKTEATENDRPQPTVTKVSGSGVMGYVSDAKDFVAAPFAGSRAPQSNEKLPGPGTDSVDQTTKTSGNAEGIRTTEDPHTVHTELAPPREEGTHVGGTGVADPKIVEPKTSETAGTEIGNGAADPRVGNGATEPSGDVTHIPGVSTQGGGQGKIVAHEDTIKTADAHEKEKEKEKGSKSGGSRLWSKSRTSVDEPTGTRRSKSRFNEEGAGSESGSAPASPSSSRIKVPLKDKIKGELKIISGKMSKNEAKVEQGIALKTGGATSPK